MDTDIVNINTNMHLEGGLRISGALFLILGNPPFSHTVRGERNRKLDVLNIRHIYRNKSNNMHAIYIQKKIKVGSKEKRERRKLHVILLTFQWQNIIYYKNLLSTFFFYLI